MIRKGTRYLLLLLFMSMCFCAGADYVKPAGVIKKVKKEVKTKQVFAGQITSFSIPVEIAPAVIDQTNGIIGIAVHAGTDISNLTPTITITPGSTVSPASGVPNDFNGAPLYTVDPLTTPVHYNVQVFAAHTAATCPGVPALLTGNTPIPSGTFKWEQLNTATSTWSAAPGATSTNADYTTPALANPTNAPKIFTFRRAITFGGTTYDSYYDLTVNPSTAITGNSINQPTAVNSTFCASGDPGTITGNPPSGGLGAGSYTYKWQSSTSGAFTDIPGATNPDLTPGTITTTTTYQRIVTSGTCTPPTTSGKVKITILSAITNNKLFEPGTISYCGPSIASIINGNIPSGGTGTFAYQWQSCTDGVSFTNIPPVAGESAKRQDYNHPVLAQTTYYRRMARSGTCATPVPSDNVIVITIQSGLSNNAISAPGATTFCVSGDPGTFDGSQPGGGNGIYNYKWQSSPDGGTFTDIAPAATGITYTPGTLTGTIYYRRAVTSGSCTTPLYSNPIVITIQPALGNNSIQPPLTTTYCQSGSPGPIPGSIPTGGDGTYTIVWQSSVNGGPFTDIQNSNVQNYDPALVSQTTTYQRTVISGACSTRLISNQVTITIQPPLGGNTLIAPSAGIHCASYAPGPIQDSPPIGGDGNYVYTWQSAPAPGGPFTDVSGINLHAKNFDPGAVTQTTCYRRTVTSGLCTTPLNSNTITIYIDPPLDNNSITQPANSIFCGPGSPGFITGSVPTGGGGSYTYVWQSSVNGSPFIDIPNSNVQTYGPGLVTQTTTYQRNVTSGSCNTPLVSGTVTITILPPVAGNTITAPSTSTFCVNGDPPIMTGSIPTGGDGTTYSYQWQSSADGTNFTDINGATLKDYDSPPINATTYFLRNVISGSCSTPLASNVITLTVYRGVTNNTITAPSTAVFCQTGDPAAITGSAPANGDGTYQYRWQSSPTNSNFADIPGATNINYDPPVLNATMFYQRIVTSGICTIPVISNVIEIHVTAPLNAGSNQIQPPLITNNCTSVDPATIIGNIPSGGDGFDSFHYQWESSTNNGATWTPVQSDGNAPDYDPPPITVSTMYHRNVTSGTCTVPLTSNAVTLTIVDSPPNITISNVAPICAGNTATLSIVSPDAALTYNWYDTPTRDNLLYQGPTFTTLALTANQTFYAEASNGTCSSPQLASVDVTVNPLPEVPVLTETAPTGCNGSSVTLHVSNPQGSLTYKWYTAATGGAPVFTGPDFTTPVLTGDITYYVDATSSSGCVSPSRANAAITVYPLPVAVAKGADICPGTIAILTANEPDPDEEIRWYTSATGGESIFTGNSFTTPIINTPTTYYAEAVNTVSGCVSATRSPAKVQILGPLSPPPQVSVTSSVAPEITFTWIRVLGATGYRVSVDGGASYTDPSSGSSGTSHTVTGLQVGQRVTIIVHTLGSSSCQTSTDTNPVTGVASDPDVDKIFVANAFTPNGDGRNDVVYVHNDNVKSLKFYVYDQWGNMLFESLSQPKGWDGTYKGKTEPAGVYVYYLEATMNDGKLVTKKGTITLLR